MSYKILTPIKVGPLELPNRVMYLAMAKYLSTPDNFITDRQIAYYENYAKNGVALLTPGACLTFPEYPSKLPCQPGIYDDKFLPGMKKLVDAVHKHGAKIFFQPWHPGATPYGCDVSELKTVADFTLEEIKDLQKGFLDAATRAQEAGADGVEVHIAHNYLLEQFLTSLFNKRTDDYGSHTMESGLRFSTEIIRMIKETCGPDFAVTAKINGNDFDPAGMTAEKAALAGPILEAAGVDMISVSAGGSLTNILGMSADGNQSEGWKAPLAEAVKKSGVKIPVMATGSIRHPDFVEQLLQEGKCDMVGMGRGLLAEPEWVSKLTQGREDEMRACVSCMACFNFTSPGSAGCTINPRALRESEHLELKKNGARRTVVVVGAGPAGLEAAIALAERDFKPVILEKGKELGGMEIMAARPDGKAKVLWHLDYYKKQIARLGIDVRFGETAMQESIAALNPYAVFVATGSLPVFPSSIPGVKKPQVSEVRQTLEAFPDVTGETIVLVGAGLVGLENSITFANRGNKVSIIDMLPPYDPNKSPVDLMLTFDHAMQCGVEIHMGHKLLEITDDAVIAENLDTGKKVSFPAQRVVFCMGVTSNNRLYGEIKDAFPKVYNIGDSAATGTILNAVSSAFNSVIALD